MKHRNILLFGALALLTSLLLIPASYAAPAPALVRVVHAISNAPGVDVYVDDAIPPGLTNVTFTTYSPYLQVPAGSRTIVIRQNPSLPSGPALLSATLLLLPGQAYTVVARGLIGGSGDQAPGLTTTVDDLSPPPAGSTKFRVFHFVPTAPAVDVRAAGVTAPLVDDLTYPNNSGYRTAPAGTYDLSVTSDDGTATLLAIGPVALNAGTIYDFFAMPESPGPLQIITSAISTTARVRVVHASPNAPNVDVYVNDVLTLRNLPFFYVSDYLDVAAGTVQVRVTVAGDPSNVVVPNTPLILNAGQVYSVVARGLVGGSGGQAFGVSVYNDNLNAPASGNAKVRVYHLSPDAPTVDVRVRGTTTALPGLDDLAYNVPSGYLEVPANLYNLEVADEANQPALLSLINANLEAGRIYDIFAVGQATITTPTIRLETRISDTKARLRVVHAATADSGAPPVVDVYANGVLTLNDVPFFTVSDYLLLPAGTLPISITGSTSTTPLLETTLTLEAGKSYTVAARGRFPSTFGLSLFVDSLSVPPAGRAKVRVYHFSTLAPATVDITTAGGATTLIDDLEFADASAYLVVPGGTYDLELRNASGSGSPVALSGLVFRSGLITELFAIDDSGRLGTRANIEEPQNILYYRVTLPLITR